MSKASSNWTAKMPFKTSKHAEPTKQILTRPRAISQNDQIMKEISQMAKRTQRSCSISNTKSKLPTKSDQQLSKSSTLGFSHPSDLALLQEYFSSRVNSCDNITPSTLDFIIKRLSTYYELGGATQKSASHTSCHLFCRDIIEQQIGYRHLDNLKDFFKSVL